MLDPRVPLTIQGKYIVGKIQDMGILVDCCGHTGEQTVPRYPRYGPPPGDYFARQRPGAPRQPTQFQRSGDRGRRSASGRPTSPYVEAASSSLAAVSRMAASLCSTSLPRPARSSAITACMSKNTECLPSA